MAKGNRTTSKAPRANVAKVTKATPAHDRPLYVLLADNIEKRANSALLARCNLQNLAGLLAGLSEAGYAEASATKDEWQQAWWEQAGYLADVLAREAGDLQREMEAVETLAQQIGGAK